MSLAGLAVLVVLVVTGFITAAAVLAMNAVNSTVEYVADGASGAISQFVPPPGNYDVAGSVPSGSDTEPGWPDPECFDYVKEYLGYYNASEGQTCTWAGLDAYKKVTQQDVEAEPIPVENMQDVEYDTYGECVYSLAMSLQMNLTDSEIFRVCGEP